MHMTPLLPAGTQRVEYGWSKRGRSREDQWRSEGEGRVREKGVRKDEEQFLCHLFSL
jgi:hypothetical protein